MSDETTEKAGQTLAASGLLGCPFCGEQPEYQAAAKDPNNPPYGWPHQIVHNCRVLGQQICVRAHHAFMADTKDNVFRLWNTRSQPNNELSGAKRPLQ